MRPSVEFVFIELVDAFAKDDRVLSASPHAQNFAPKLFEGHPARQGYRRADFARAMEILFSKRAIMTVEYGRPGDGRRKIVRGYTEEQNG